jgi:hypothetical protein
MKRFLLFAFGCWLTLGGLYEAYDPVVILIARLDHSAPAFSSAVRDHVTIGLIWAALLLLFGVVALRAALRSNGASQPQQANKSDDQRNLS